MVAQPIHLNWFNPVHITFGVGCFASIAQRLSEAQQALPVVVFADRVALSTANEAALATALGTRCKVWAWFQGGLATVAQAFAFCQQLWPVMQQFPSAVVLAIGGGSTLDLAKVLRYRDAKFDTATLAHWRNNTLPEKFTRHALWLIPTTSGTGSEVTRWATLWDNDAAVHAKLSWSPADGFGERAFVDPALTMSCPLRTTRDCALDALAHALESIWNRHANVATCALAVQAARGVIAVLPQVLQSPNDLALRARLSQASLLAGLAMSQTQTALAHALSYELTLREGLAHGEACAVWLPMVWELALGASELCDGALANIFEVSGVEGVHQLRHWLHQLGISPRELRSDASGLARLTTEMKSARGKNFNAKH